MRILLIAGGWSNEREISLKGAATVERALLELGHEVVSFDPAVELHQLPRTASECDFAFVNLHGSPGEDGIIQAILERSGCPYQGSGPAGSLLGLDKAAAKSLMRHAMIPTPNWEFLPVPPPSDWTTKLSFPVFAKPTCAGSSLGVSFVEDEPRLREAVEELLAAGNQVLIEERVTGLEMTCAVFGTEPLPPILIEHPETAGFFDYRSKYTPDAAKELCPAPVSEDIRSSVGDLALRVHRALGLSGYSRTDFIVSGNQPFALEVNTLPGMTDTSLFLRSARTAGYSTEEAIAGLIDLGMRRHKTNGDSYARPAS
jgi:D-alanine-D-alanine ligase